MSLCRPLSVPLLMRASLCLLAMGGGGLSACSRSPQPPPDQPPPEQILEQPPAQQPAWQGPTDFHFAREGVLGTSLDLTVEADSQTQADAVLVEVQSEITRREALMSTWLAGSELSVINATPFTAGEHISLSTSLGMLLSEAHSLGRVTDGAFSAYAGELLDLWSTGSQPDAGAIKTAVAHIDHGFHIQRAKKRRYLVRDHPGQFQLDAIGKGYVIDKALREAHQAVPQARALSLDLGGDIAVWGDRDWIIDVADPLHPQDNAPPLTRVSLRNLAIATSGTYARPLVVDGQSRSHIIDPRSGQPAQGVLQATVVAPTARSADALATALMVLGPDVGLPIIESQTPAFALVLTEDGVLHRSRGFSVLESAVPERAVLQNAVLQNAVLQNAVGDTITKASSEQRSTSLVGPAWPQGFAVNIDLELVNSWLTDPPKGRQHDFKRHFLAAWVEDATGRPVRTLAVWAKSKDLGYVRDLRSFYKYGWLLGGGGDSPKPLRSVSRATRKPGHYSLRWDGRDAGGQLVEQGRYTIYVEANREHGPPNGHEEASLASVVLDCGTVPARAEAPDQTELHGVVATYGPPASP